MKKTIKYIGLDVHKNSIAIAIAEDDRQRDVNFYGVINNDMDQLYKFLRKQISQGVEPRCVYEAGPCGYNLYRTLSEKGIDCIVVAPSLIPKKSGDKIKTDQRDSKSLARLHRSGELTPVYVPSIEEEALRDLVRARDDLVNVHKRAKQQLGAFLLRHHIYYPGKSKWSKTHFTWLTGVSMPHPAQQITLQEYIDMVHDAKTRVERISDQIRQLSGETQLNYLGKAIQSLRGVSEIVSAVVVSEIGDLTRFDSPTKFMAYLGLVPSLYNSGEKTKSGKITKTGNGHVRRALIEAAQAYRLPARKSRAITKRNENLPPEICKIAWKAQVRLCGRYKRLLLKGKNSNLIKTAIARELAGFMWSIAHAVPKNT
jgi:transposase